MSGHLLEAALGYASHGWPVFPVALAVDARCGCGWASEYCTSPGKHPMNKGGCRAASTDPGQIADWWRRWPSANIGIATGRAADLAVLDVDGAQGRNSLARIEAEHGPLPGTVTAITSRGCHLLYRWTEGLGIGAGQYGAGLDHRGEGGYIIAPPSVHPSGHVYRWQNASGDSHPWGHPLPAWPSDALPLPKSGADVLPFRPREVSVSGGAEGGVLAGLVRAVLVAAVGQRNSTLNWAAFRAGEHIRAGRLDQVQAVTALQKAAEQAGLTVAESVATIASGLSKGLVA